MLKYLPCKTTSSSEEPVDDRLERIEKSIAEIADLMAQKNLPDDSKDDNSANSIPAHAKAGVDPVYLKLFQEARERSNKDFDSYHNEGEAGIVIGPTEGKFKYTVEAIQNARRIRSILTASDSNLKLNLALMTSPQHLEILSGCDVLTDDSISKFRQEIEINPNQKREACRLWSNGTLFDLIIPTSEAPYKGNDNHTQLNQGTSHYWLKALGGYRLAPYTHTLFIDSNSFPCPGIENLFQLTKPSDKNFGKYWQPTTTGAGDLAVGIDQYASWQNDEWIPGFKTFIGEDSIKFAERNTGAVLFNFQRQLSHTLAHFIPLVAEHIYNNVASTKQKVPNDQVAFRVALYLFRRFEQGYVEHQIPMHTSCRSYPGKDYAGTDGFLNGMYPLKSDGTFCDECYCTPCLINHGVHTVKINGAMGWEEGSFNRTTPGAPPSSPRYNNDNIATFTVPGNGTDRSMNETK